VTQIEPGFDCVRMMRELREELYRETEGMSPEERTALIHDRAQRFWRERAGRSSTDASAVALRRSEKPAVPKPEKPFDSVRLMRELRDQIDHDVRNMTEEQRDEYIRGRAERFWTQLAEKEQRAAVAVSH
jgi:hypothetical protein